VCLGSLKKIENVPEHISKLRAAKDVFNQVYEFKPGVFGCLGKRFKEQSQTSTQ